MDDLELYLFKDTLNNLLKGKLENGTIQLKGWEVKIEGLFTQLEYVLISACDKDDLDYYLAGKQKSQINLESINEFQERYNQIISETNDSWTKMKKNV